jgi:DNA-binding transcriptional MerR regulator
MRFYRLKEVSRILGGSPRPATLRSWCQRGLILHSRTIGGKVYLLSEDQLKSLQVQLERGGDDEASEAASGQRVVEAR